MPLVDSSRGIVLPAAFISAIRRLAAIVSRKVRKPILVMRHNEAVSTAVSAVFSPWSFRKLMKRTPPSAPAIVPTAMSTPSLRSRLPSCPCRSVAMMDFPAMCVVSVPTAKFDGKPITIMAGVTMKPPPTPINPPTMPIVKPMNSRRGSNTSASISWKKIMMPGHWPLRLQALHSLRSVLSSSPHIRRSLSASP